MLPLQSKLGYPVQDIIEPHQKIIYIILLTFSLPKSAFNLDLNAGTYLYQLLGKTEIPLKSKITEDIRQTALSIGLSETEFSELFSLVEDIEIKLKYLYKDQDEQIRIVDYLEVAEVMPRPNVIQFYEITITIDNVKYSTSIL